MSISHNPGRSILNVCNTIDSTHLLVCKEIQVSMEITLPPYVMRDLMVPSANQRQDAGFEARKLPRPYPQRRTVASRTKVRILLDVKSSLLMFCQDGDVQVRLLNPECQSSDQRKSSLTNTRSVADFDMH